MKKKLLALAIGTCIIQVSQAQISKGSWFLGGSVNFGSGKSKTDVLNSTAMDRENKQTTWGFRPQLGKAIADNRILGVYFNLGGSKFQDELLSNKARSENSIYGGGIFLRQYYSIGKRFFVFGEGSLGLDYSKGEAWVTQGGPERKDFSSRNFTTSLNLSPGISYQAGRKLFLEAYLNSLLRLSYQSGWVKRYNTQGALLEEGTGNSFSVSANANGVSDIAIGLRWILPARK